MQQQFQISELSQEDLTTVIRRAQALEAEKLTTLEPQTNLETFVSAAEEMGISREAVMQALREKMGHPLEGIAPGDRVFAKSADGAFYMATVTALQNNAVTVHFMNGSDHTVALTDLRGPSILPGQKLQVNWPGWGWWTVTVEKYNSQKEKVTATDGMSSKSFSLTEVRLPIERTKRELSVRALLFRTAIVSAGVGVAIGALLIRFFS